jgi:hypothetical protein
MIMEMRTCRDSGARAVLRVGQEWRQSIRPAQAGDAANVGDATDAGDAVPTA